MTSVVMGLFKFIVMCTKCCDYIAQGILFAIVLLKGWCMCMGKCCDRSVYN